MDAKALENDMYAFFDFSEDEQRQFLGQNIAEDTRIVELDEASMRYFYRKRFAPLIIREVPATNNRLAFFQVVVQSIDDADLVLQWDVKDMAVLPYEARMLIDARMQRSGWFINLQGFKNFCIVMFGSKVFDNSNGV